MIILSACNKKYEHFVRPLVMSVLKNTPHNIRVDYITDHGRDDEEARRDYTANYRIQMFRSCPPGEHMLWLDADTIVRQPLTEIEKVLNEYDTAAVATPEMGSYGTEHSWLISTIGISGTTRGQDFLAEWERQQAIYHPQMYPSIMTCQLSYVKALEACKSWLKVKDLTYWWSDKHMRECTPIWEGQGARKHEDGNFKRELEIYRQC